MKTAYDPRHLSRIKAFEYLYSYYFNKEKIEQAVKTPQKQLSIDIISGVIQNKDQIDAILNKTAPQWTVENMKLVDLTILRIGVLEGFIIKSIPPNVSIDESIELAKRYGDENSPSFVNGVLGAMIKHTP